MRRAIVPCGLLAACHAPGAKPNSAVVESWEVKNDSPCDAPVRIQTYGGELVQRLGTVPAGTTQSFDVFSTLMKGNTVTAYPVEPGGGSCQNNPLYESKVVVRKLPSREVD